MGPLTAVPLLLFAAGARRISMTTLGLLQYIGPSIQFALGVWLFNEPSAGSASQASADLGRLLLYSADGWRSARRAASSCLRYPQAAAAELALLGRWRRPWGAPKALAG